MFPHEQDGSEYHDKLIMFKRGLFERSDPQAMY